LVLDPVDLAANRGRSIVIGRNSNASTPAAGSIWFERKDGSATYAVWPDIAMLLRIGSVGPTTDTSGTVVGDQTSWYEYKNIIRTRTDATAALQAVLDTKVEDFTYKNSTYFDKDGNPEVFTGLVIRDRTEWYGKNLGPQQIPALNEVNVAGYTVLSIQALNNTIKEQQKEIGELRQELAEIKQQLALLAAPVAKEK